MTRKFITDYPNLIKEWDYEKNVGINPHKVGFGSNKLFWWKCSKGHSWQARPANRTRLGRSCPYCAHQKPVVGVNDFQTLFPEISRELHPTKNGNLNPSQTMPGTHKEAWFICPKCGSEYKMRIYSRTKGMGCPVCANKRIVKGINDFQTKHPDAAKDWHPTKNGIHLPSDFSSNSSFEAWWRCPLGHEYKSKIVYKANGKQCPVCTMANKTSFPEQAILYYVKKYFPDAINGYRGIFKNAMEIDVYIPSIKVGIEYDGMAWHNTKINIERDIRKYNICKENGIYLIRVREKPYEEDIKACDLLLVLENLLDSRFLNREIYHVLLVVTSRKDPLKLFLPNKKSSFEQMMETAKLMDVDVERDRRKIQKYLTEFEDSLAKYRPDLIDEWDFEKNKPLTPFNVKFKSNERVWWKCKRCGNKWQAVIAERTGHSKTNCPICANSIGGSKHHEFVLKQKGSIVKTHPHILRKWDYDKNSLSPDDVTAGSGEKVWWKCPDCGYSWQTSVCHMASRDSGCPCCRNKVTVSGINDIATKYPNLLLDWDYNKNVGLDPHKISIAGRRAWWKCHICGHEWNSLIASRAKGTGCPKCAVERRKQNHGKK